MQKGPRPPLGTDVQLVVRKILDSLLEPSGSPVAVRRRRWTPRRSASVLAIGVVGLFAWQGWDPDVVVPRAMERVEEVAPMVELPMAVNERVEKWMRRFMTDQRRSFQKYLEREGRYAAIIRDELRERGMPEDLIYLAMIESGFSSKATSRVSAAGVWQFMGPTARQYGLRVDRHVDERRDPVKATAAALDYLQYLHSHYGSWYLAAAAYNAGPARVDRIVKRYAGDRRGDDDIYWEIIDHLPRETREYVPKLLAAAALAKEAERYGFHVIQEDAYRYDRVWVPGATPLTMVAKALGVETALLRELNPHLMRPTTPPGASFALRVPMGTGNDLIAFMGGEGRATGVAVAD